jgi:aspartate/methionine/tyrosine aminotransferase
MIAQPSRWATRAPDVPRRQLAKNALLLSGYNARELPDRWRPMLGVANECGVLIVGHRVDADAELVQMNTVWRALVLVAFLRAHDELTGRNSGDLGVDPVADVQDDASIGVNCNSMKIEPFAMERMQSTYENEVEFNLSESGVHPVSVRELLDDPADWEGLLDQPLVYPQSNGTRELRERVAALYPGATASNVEVTNGGSEANYIVTWRLVEPSDEVVVMVPNYMQTRGLARAFGGHVREWKLRPDSVARRWSVDLDELKTLVTAKTRLIIICNPNNPTGARLSGSELDAICRIAGQHGAWVLSDEIYRGAERDAQETESVWGRYDRAVVTSGLSKAYGLPGLRIGWIAGPADLTASTWSYHDYMTIAPGALSDRLARAALSPARRQRLLQRTRTILRDNLPLLEQWLSMQNGAFSWIAPEAGAIIYVRYAHDINSLELADRLRIERSVLIVPGEHFGMDRYLRLGYGERPDYLRAGLDRVAALLSTLPLERGAGAPS